MSLASLRQEASGCQRCPLYRQATQTVFGEGPRRARIMLIGEQPGDQEDRLGRPFVGPAGRVLMEALAEAGLSRSQVYLTNVVKHFKWEPKGGMRLHKKPGALEIRACLPWLRQEVEELQPELLVLLGATAAQAVLGRDFRVTKQRGVPLPSPWRGQALATVHPSSILRQRTSEDRQRERALFVADLKVAAELLKQVGEGR